MARGEEPLLARRPSSTNSQEQTAATEEDALLTGQRTTRDAPSRWARWREIGVFVWALFATAAVVILAVVYQHKQNEHAHNHHSASGRPSGKRNLVFMVSDGMGPASLSLTRSWRQYTDGLPYDDTLVLDGHLVGQSRTRSSNSLVTDSAAGATAFSCGMKSYNGAISVLPDFSPCGSVMEAAKKAGYTTGLVVTTRITDATPACFASHVRKREMEDMIAEQLIGNSPLGRSVDLILGGGRCHFLPNSTEGGCRADDSDVIHSAEKKGWNYISTREDFDNLGSAVKLPLLGLFAPGDIPFEIDRRHLDDEYPSLEEMAKTALQALKEATRDSDQGFFIMIEGSRVDHAGHINDPAAQVHEVLAYDRTVAAVLKFLEEDDVPGVMISTSDHETGGLSTARQLHATYPDYLWYPSVLANASHSSEYAARQFRAHLASHPELTTSTRSEDLRAWLATLVSKSLGIDDATSAELDLLIKLTKYPAASVFVFADMISRRAQIGWSTHGHSAVDVNIYASDAKLARKLRGNHENVEVGQFLRWWLDVDDEVDAVTRELREKLEIKAAGVGGEDWLGPVPVEGERLDGYGHDGLEIYDQMKMLTA